MNGIEKITQRIEADAQAEIERILSEAKAEAAEIAAKYRAQAEAEAAELAAKNERAAAEREERLESAAQMEARKTMLSAKQELVDSVYAKALEKLCGLPDEQYTEVLAALMCKASSSGRETAIFSEKDRARVGAAVVEKANEQSKGSLTVSDETRNICGGFILKDQNVEVNCTFDALVRLQKAETAGAIAKILFPEA